MLSSASPHLPKPKGFVIAHSRCRCYFQPNMTSRRLLCRITLLLLSAFSVLGHGYLRAQTAPTPGQIRPRPAEGRQPDLPLPNIREYHPNSTLVVPQHPIARAKFPVIDIHSHHPTPISPEQYAQVVKAMDQQNLKL